MIGSGRIFYVFLKEQIPDISCAPDTFPSSRDLSLTATHMISPKVIVWQGRPMFTVFLTTVAVIIMQHRGERL